MGESEQAVFQEPPAGRPDHCRRMAFREHSPIFQAFVQALRLPPIPILYAVLGDWVQFFATFLLILEILYRKNCRGMSIDTHVMLAIASWARIADPAQRHPLLRLGQPVLVLIVLILMIIIVSRGAT